MSVDYPFVQFVAERSALKLFKSGTGAFSTPATTNYTETITIPHGYPNDQLIFQVTVKRISLQQTYVSPFYGNSGALLINSELDSTNLIIRVKVSGFITQPADNWNYTYRILIP